MKAWRITTPEKPGWSAASEGEDARDALELFAELRGVEGRVERDGSWRVALHTRGGMTYYASRAA